MGENIKYRLLTSEDEKKLRELVNTVVGGLERKEFFIPYEDWEYKEMFDEGYAINYGAFDGEKLVAMGQIYVKQEMIEDYKKLLDIEDKRACELGGALCLKEYRRYGLMFHIMEYLSTMAKEKEFEYIVICGGSSLDTLGNCTPCGYCRQFMSEFVDKNFKI